MQQPYSLVDQQLGPAPRYEYTRVHADTAPVEPGPANNVFKGHAVHPAIHPPGERPRAWGFIHQKACLILSEHTTGRPQHGSDRSHRLKRGSGSGRWHHHFPSPSSRAPSTADADAAQQLAPHLKQSTTEANSEPGLSTEPPHCDASAEPNAIPHFHRNTAVCWQDGVMTAPSEQPIIWTGTYTADGGGRAEGIGALAENPDGSLEWLGTAVKADSPSFISVHPTLPVVYAVAEQRKMVRSFRRSGAFGLEPLGDPQPAGEATCHVAADPQGRFITAACWGDGQVLLYELDADGGMAGRFPAAPSADPHASLNPGEPRQSRAHASLMLADGRIMTTDLGHDVIRIWNYVPGTGLVADHEVALPFGSGPRHLVQHRSGNVFVVSEYSVEVFVLRPEAGTFELVFRGPATAGGSLADDSAAEICLGRRGHFAYVGVRGSNIISTLEVRDGGTELLPVKDTPSGGNWPRHHLVRGSWLHVAHERSDNIATFALDAVTGLPGPLVHDLQAPSPTALVPAG